VEVKRRGKRTSVGLEELSVGKDNWGGDIIVVVLERSIMVASSEGCGGGLGRGFSAVSLHK